MQVQKHFTVGEFAAKREREREREREDVSLRMEANYWSRAKGTCRLTESLALYGLETL